MAHKKGQGTSRNGRDSNAQRRGVKKYGGEYTISCRECWFRFTCTIPLGKL